PCLPLPSFPTRRSSDLYLTGVQERLRRAELERAEAQVKAAEERKRRRSALALAAAVLLALLAGGGAYTVTLQQRQQRQEQTSLLDRKSTRLNSSHQIIS